jgi:nucleotide-binding universal stress UspA family protein
MRRILVGVDGSPQGDKALEFALQMASQFQSELHCCAVVYGPDIEMAEASDREALVNRQRERMAAHLDTLNSSASARKQPLQTHLLEGHPVEQLLALAERLDVDHMILGHRSKGLFERLLMGSVAKRVVDFARCSVTVVR